MAAPHDILVGGWSAVLLAVVVSGGGAVKVVAVVENANDRKQ